MANQMPGQLRVANDIGPQANIDTRVSQIGSSGLQGAANAVAGEFAKIGERVGQMADVAAAKEGAAAGRVAGLDVEFRAANNGTIRGDAFDKAGLDVAETRLRQQIDADFDGAFVAHAGDPSALNNALNIKRMAIIANAPAELRPGLDQLMTGKRLAYSREQARRVAAEAASASRAAIETQLGETLKGVHQRAFALGLDEQADAVLQADVQALARTLERRGPDGVRLISPEAAAKQLDAVKETVATARVSGAFQRLPSLASKAEFIKQFEEDFAASKGLAKTYDLQGFERVKGALEADYRAAATQEATASRALGEEVKSVAKMAEQGYAPPPDELAALRSRVTASSDAELVQDLALAENTMAWQASARRSTPQELDAFIRAEDARLKTTGATPTEVARLTMARALHQTVRSELKQDPLGWADRVGNITLTPIDASTPETLNGSLKARLAQAETVAGLYGIEPVYLRPDENKATATRMAQGGPQALQVAATLANLPGDRGPRVLAELSNQAPVMAVLGHIVRYGADGRPPAAAVDAFDALAARQAQRSADGSKPLPPVAMPKAADTQRLVNEIAGGALAWDVQTQAAVINSADLVYEIRAARENATAFKPDLYKQALAEVLGEQTVGNVKYGGVVKQGAQPGRGYWRDDIDIVLPADIRQDGWDDVVGAITPSVLDRAGIGQPVSKTGKAIDFARFKQGTFVQAGNGKYFVALGDAAKPGGEQFAVDGKTGKPLLLDFDKLSPVLRSLRSDLFLGAR